MTKEQKLINDLTGIVENGSRSRTKDTIIALIRAALASYAEQAPPDTGDRNPYNLDWPKQYPIMSNVQDRTGISIEWQMVWSEVEGWYGDPKKKETGEQFLKRLQSQFMLIKRGGQVTGKSAGPELLQQIKDEYAKELGAQSYKRLLDMWEYSTGISSWMDERTFMDEVAKRYAESCNLSALNALKEIIRKGDGIEDYVVTDLVSIAKSGEAGKLPEQRPADPWIPLKSRDKQGHLEAGKDFLFLYDTGEIRRKDEEEQPFAMITHYMIIPDGPGQTKVSGEQKGGEQP